MIHQHLINNRVIEHAKYFLNNNTTIRGVAKHTNTSKTTVHLDLTERLPKINPHLYNQVRKKLDQNKATRHIKGGLSTKKFWQKKIYKKNTTSTQKKS